PSTTAAYNGIESVVTYPMTKGSFEVELLQVPTDVNAEIQLYALVDTNNKYLLSISNGFLTLYITSAGVKTMVPVAFAPPTDHYMRIPDGGDGFVYVDSAPPGSTTWNQRIQHTLSVAFTMLTIGVDAGTYNTGITGAQTAKLDNVVVHAPACQ